ncbi:MAG: deoxyribose-phosphate aldolase, partial [Eudoraea sp.]|nr:deoxyribose-phosphate aldolase [Eudoraea sp.]
MKPFYFILALILIGCRDRAANTLTAQQIVDRAIEAAGGELYEHSNFSFSFREKTYKLEKVGRYKILKRITKSDTAIITDIKRGNNFERWVNDSIVQVVDSMAHKYANSINSVHYFAYLPYGLNDGAVNKKLLG